MPGSGNEDEAVGGKELLAQAEQQAGGNEMNGQRDQRVFWAYSPSECELRFITGEKSPRAPWRGSIIQPREPQPAAADAAALPGRRPYGMFFEDAKEATELLDVVLEKGNAAPMDRCRQVVNSAPRVATRRPEGGKKVPVDPSHKALSPSPHFYLKSKRR